MNINTFKDFETYQLNNVEYKILKIPNVVSYNYNPAYEIIIHCNETNFTETKYYFCIDLFIDSAFSHWVFESGIYLPIYKTLLNKYPTLKLTLKHPRKYKKIFCDFFDIPDSCIEYKFDDTTNTICLFPNPISSLNYPEIPDEYKLQLNYFMSLFSYCHENNKTTDILLLPRQKQENYSCNDRLCEITEIEEWVNKQNNSLILNTDSIEKLTDQINVVSSAKTLILTDGSPFLVNGIFCKKTKIFLLYNITHHQSITYLKLRYIHDYIYENNEVIRIFDNNVSSIQ